MSKRLRIIVCLLVVAASMAFAIDDIYYWPSTSPAPSASVKTKTNTKMKTKADTVVVATPQIRVVNEQDTTVTIVVRR